MKQSVVKMMSRIAEVENYILKGLVLDEHGNWVPIADKKAVEDDFLAHLFAGQVVHEGRWVTFAEAKQKRPSPVPRPSGAKTPATTSPAQKVTASETEIIVADTALPEDDTRISQSFELPQGKFQEAEPLPPETAVIVEAPSPEEETRIGQSSVPPAGKTGTEADLFPPETSIILEAQTAEEETRIGLAPPSPSEVVVSTDEFAPETKVLYIARPDEKVQQFTSETDALPVEPSGPGRERQSSVPAAEKKERIRALHRPAAPSLTDSGEKRKKMILLIGGALVILAGIAAVLIIVLQVPK